MLQVGARKTRLCLHILNATFADDAPHSPLKSFGPLDLRPCALDAFLVFEALCKLTNGTKSPWLQNVPGFKQTEITIERELGLELIENILVLIKGNDMYMHHPELSQTLRERVCPLVMKAFSDASIWPVCVRLMRIVNILIVSFGEVLVMEVEIFFNMLLKLLDASGPLHVCNLVLEVVENVVTRPENLVRIVEYYDDQEQSTNIFEESVHAVAQCIKWVCEHKLHKAIPEANHQKWYVIPALSGHLLTCRLQSVDALRARASQEACGLRCSCWSRRRRACGGCHRTTCWCRG